MSNDILPSDIDPDSCNRLPLPDPETLDETSRATYDSLADPEGGSLAGLRGPGGLRLHSPALSNGLRPVNMHLRQPDVIIGYPHDAQHEAQRGRNQIMHSQEVGQ